MHHIGLVGRVRNQSAQAQQLDPGWVPDWPRKRCSPQGMQCQGLENESLRCACARYALL